MQYRFLVFLQKHSSPLLDFLSNFFSAFGEQFLFILIIVIVYYGIDKKKGYAVFSSMTLSLSFNNAVKALVRYPRPFMVHPDLSGGRLSTATGYSFPSGHSAGATSFYVALGVAFKNKALTASSLVFCAFIALSRLYFAVHWPLDVFVGFMIGLVSSFALVPFLLRKYEDENFKTKWTSSITLISFVVALALMIALTLGANERAFSDLMKMLSVTAGGYGGCLLEWRHIKFKARRRVKYTVINTLLSLFCVVLIMAAGALFKGASYYTGALIRYALMGFFITFVYPAFAVRVGLLENEKI